MRLAYGCFIKSVIIVTVIRGLNENYCVLACVLLIRWLCYTRITEISVGITEIISKMMSKLVILSMNLCRIIGYLIVLLGIMMTKGIV